MPWWSISWDVFCWLGHRRFARHWSVPQLRLELLDSYDIVLSEDAIEDYLQCYQCMLAARQQDPALLEQDYRTTHHVMLSIDGLQPEKGHETLYVVRELREERVWFAEALLSSATNEIRPLIVRARDWAKRLGLPVRLWMSDKQDAFVKTIAKEFPGVPHRYCGNHFLRDLAKPMLELDSHAKVQMRGKIRGLRGIEREVLKVRAANGIDHAEHEDGCSLCRRMAWESCSIIVRRFVASSTTVKEAPCVRRVCGWPKRWVKCSSRCGATFGSKKGGRGAVAGAFDRLHRQRKKLGGGHAETSGGVCRDDSQGRRGT